MRPGGANVNHRQLPQAASEASLEATPLASRRATAEHPRLRSPTSQRTIPRPAVLTGGTRFVTVGGFSVMRRPVRRNRQLKFQAARSASSVDSDPGLTERDRPARRGSSPNKKQRGPIPRAALPVCAAVVLGQEVPAYRHERKVAVDRLTETYVALMLDINRGWLHTAIRP